MTCWYRKNQMYFFRLLYNHSERKKITKPMMVLTVNVHIVELQKKTKFKIAQMQCKFSSLSTNGYTAKNLHRYNLLVYMSVFWGSLKCFNVSFTVIKQVCPTKSGWNLHCRFVCFKILLNTSETRIDALMLCYLLELDDLRPYVYLSLNYLTKSKETYMYRVLQNHYVPSTIWSINDIIKYFIPKWCLWKM
jgi:hypothetical protein